VLKLKDDEHFEGFCEVLEATGQNSAVKSCFLGHYVRDSHLYLLSITLVIPTCCSYYVPAHIAGTLSASARLTSVCLSYAYIMPKSGTETLRETEIATEIAHVTRDSDTTFKI